jgi:aspartyl-tRNA(Asn)/glutamyl-tRNA(Gln) amidotransferase subunit C
MNKEMILALAKELNFSLSEDEVNNIHVEFESLLQLLALLDTIDTEGVEPMVYPFETPLTSLREDEVTHELTQEEALRNASKVKDGLVVVPKVVKS